ncbi:MAG: heat-inducible transcriptional repressor HrcA [bacterium]
MYSDLLSQRESIILRSVVECYVQNAAPVGSRLLVKKYELGVGPATIRNVMNDLEEMGYLQQPHVSAGRVPTDKGYRFYVDSMMTVPSLAQNERRIILDNLRKVSVDVYDLFETTSQILGKISSQLGVVLEPRFHQGVLQKIELVSIAENKILAVISIKSGFVKTIMLEVDITLSPSQLQKTSWFINERLAGLTLKQIKDTIGVRLTSSAANVNHKLIHLIVKSSHKLFSFDDEKNLHLGGTHNIVSNPEFSDRNETVKLLELIESKRGILHQFNETPEEKLSITIGGENKDGMFKNCSIVSSKYCVGNVSGILGVVGPTRMQYAKIISLVNYMGKVLTRELYSNLS